MVETIVAKKWFSANGVIGFWQANSNNQDTIILQTDKGDVHLESLRQQMKKAIGQPTYSLADFVKPAKKIILVSLYDPGMQDNLEQV